MLHAATKRPIRLIFVALPNRVDHVLGQINVLEQRAPGEFAATVMPAVTSIEDPRVSGWSTRAAFEDEKSAAIGGSGGKPYLCYLSHMVAAGIVAGEKSTLPSIIMEDDVLLRSEFYRVVPALLRGPKPFPDDGLLQLGYFPRPFNPPHTPQDVLLPGSITECVYLSSDTVLMRPPSDPSGCRSEAGLPSFALGLTVEEWAWGTQGYALTATRAMSLWNARFFTVNTTRSVESLIYRDPRIHRVSLPLVVQDFSLRSTLNHDNDQENYYRLYRDFVDWSDYMRSPLKCNPPSAGSGLATSSCAPAQNNRWALRLLGSARSRAFQVYLVERPDLCPGFVSKLASKAVGEARARQIEMQVRTRSSVPGSSLLGQSRYLLRR